MAKKWEDLQELLATVSDTSALLGLLVNPKKTKVMTIGKDHEDIVVTCEGKRRPIEQGTSIHDNHGEFSFSIGNEGVN